MSDEPRRWTIYAANIAADRVVQTGGERVKLGQSVSVREDRITDSDVERFARRLRVSGLIDARAVEFSDADARDLLVYVLGGES